MNITFITAAETKKLDNDSATLELSNLGKNMAREYGRGLKKYYDVIYSSPQTDCLKTALETRQGYNEADFDNQNFLLNHPQTSTGIRVLTNLKSLKDFYIRKTFLRIKEEMEEKGLKEALVFVNKQWLKSLLSEVLAISSKDQELLGMDVYEISLVNGYWRFNYSELLEPKKKSISITN
ncbi:MAG: hypothetical protein ACXAD7_07850 [Candidatus Kariarchaeaceae archaeon]|jgi:hypothetical protein